MPSFFSRQRRREELEQLVEQLKEEKRQLEITNEDQEQKIESLAKDNKMQKQQIKKQARDLKREQKENEYLRRHAELRKSQVEALLREDPVINESFTELKETIEKEEVEHKKEKDEESQEKDEESQEKDEESQEKVSSLPLQQHDKLLLFKISNVEGLKEKFCRKLEIVYIIDQMEHAKKHKEKIKTIEKKDGNYTATQKFLELATKKELEAGWSVRLLKIIKGSKKLEHMEETIILNDKDLDEFNARIGIPRNSLLDKLSKKILADSSTLLSPMGKAEEDQGLPIVHPQLHVSGNTAFTDGELRPLEKTGTEPIYFEDVTRSDQPPLKSKNRIRNSLRNKHEESLLFIGAAGCGKTTLVKRMVKTCIEEKKMSFLIPFARIDKKEKQSLKHLIVVFLCQLHNVEYDSSEEDEAFQWILDNQDKFFLVFDGLDQSAFEISNKPYQNPDINDEFSPGDLMSLLLSRKFLPKCRLIISSRPHKLTKLDSAIKPNIIVVLNDLESKNVVKLMNYYLDGNGEEVMQKLRIKSPRIHQFVSNPLLLRLVVSLYKEVGDKDIWQYVDTTAKLFFELIERLQLSSNQESGGMDVKELNDKLAEMAFNKTMKKRVVFENKDLTEHGLSGEETQDFLFAVLKSSSKQKTERLVRPATSYHFNHQSVQELFSAQYAVEKLPPIEFEKLVKKLFPWFRKDEGKRGEFEEIGEDPFANLRAFVIGLLNGIREREPQREKTLELERFIFHKALCKHLRKIFVSKDCTPAVQEHQKQLMVDMMNFREEKTCKEIHTSLKDFEFVFQYDVRSPLKVGAHIEGFFYFIQKFMTKVKRLDLDIRNWNDKDEVRRLFQSIQTSSPKVEVEQMEIRMERRLDVVNDLVATFPRFTKMLQLRLDGIDSEREFCKKLKEEVQKLGIEKLRPTLVLEVRDDHEILLFDRDFRRN